ncbi:RNA-directed DNA polymerase, eukaryota [Tanacetum coccineum]
MGDSRSFKSKEDLTMKISNSVFVTNFPGHFSAQDIWKVCNAYGKVIDVYIPLKKSKAGKKFAFVRFIKVDNLDRLIGNLCTIWIGRFHLHANPVRFQRESRVSTAQQSKGKVGFSNSSFASVLKTGSQNPKMAYDPSPAIVLDDSCFLDNQRSIKLYALLPMKIKVIVKGRVYWIRVKELEAWSLDFSNYLSDNDTEEDESDDDIHRDQGSENGSRRFYFRSYGEFGGDWPNCLGQSAKKCWIQEINRKHKVNFVTIQETKMEDIGLFTVKALWGSFSYDFAFSPSVGSSGGILCVWDPNMFIKDSVSISDSFLAIRGTWVPTSRKLLIVSVYAPQDLSKRRVLWEYIGHLIELWDGECVILGDFNEVRTEQERFGTVFNALGANAFNQFIASTGLVDLPLEGHLSDHRPILMRELVVDYGPTPFRFFNSWFSKPGFDKLVEDSWNNSTFVETNYISLLKKKFQALKSAIKTWSKEEKQHSNAAKSSIMSRLVDLDRLFDQGNGTDDLVNERTVLLKDLQDIHNRSSLDMAQKAKIRWSIEGDENSKYFHGILNKKRSQLAIHDVLVEGDWIDEPAKVEDLERSVTYDEINRAVWDCGTNKSLGPDSFTFDFIRRYWKTIDKDVVKAVEEFFVSSNFPPGSNASFITLIPKTQDAKMVKDFRLISLIGSIYKIIAKILANRLSLVISDLVSDVQFAFVSNMQIFDGPFILNELISWCKSKKTKSMIFKVDFKKAFEPFPLVVVSC